jgi:hypothetical protein
MPSRLKVAPSRKNTLRSKLKKRVVDTLVERVDIDIDRNLFVQIRLNLLDILRKDAESGGSTAGAQNFEVGIYTHIHDLYPAGQILIML